MQEKVEKLNEIENDDEKTIRLLRQQNDILERKLIVRRELNRKYSYLLTHEVNDESFTKKTKLVEEQLRTSHKRPIFDKSQNQIRYDAQNVMTSHIPIEGEKNILFHEEPKSRQMLKEFLHMTLNDPNDCDLLFTPLPHCPEDAQCSGEEKSTLESSLHDMREREKDLFTAIRDHLLLQEQQKITFEKIDHEFEKDENYIKYTFCTDEECYDIKNDIILYDTYIERFEISGNKKNDHLNEYKLPEPEMIMNVKKKRKSKLFKNKTSRHALKRELDTLLFERESLNSSPELFTRKYAYTAHLDTVRDVIFYPEKTTHHDMMFSCSDDGTVKVWTIQRKQLLRKRKMLYIPLHIYRGHEGPVYKIHSDTKYVYSCGSDMTIRAWLIPQEGIKHKFSQRYGEVGIYERGVTKAGNDIIWDFDISSRKISEGVDNQMVCVSSDDTIKCYKYAEKVNDVGIKGIDFALMWNMNTMESENAKYRHPTAVKFLPHDTSKCIVSFQDSSFTLYDIQMEKEVMTVHTVPIDDVTNHIDHCIYTIMPMKQDSKILVTANEDKNVRLYDVKSGELINTDVQIVHTDAVSCLTESFSSTIFASGCHGCSIRTWDLKNLKIRQLFDAGRPKGDEGLSTIRYHPWKNYYFAAGGGDATIRTFNNGKVPKLTKEELKAKKKFMKAEMKKREKLEGHKRKKKKKKKKKKKNKKKKGDEENDWLEDW